MRNGFGKLPAVREGGAFLQFLLGISAEGVLSVTLQLRARILGEWEVVVVRRLRMHSQKRDQQQGG